MKKPAAKPMKKPCPICNRKRCQCRKLGLMHKHGPPWRNFASEASQEMDSQKAAIRKAIDEHITEGGLVTAPDTLVDRIFAVLGGEE